MSYHSLCLINNRYIIIFIKNLKRNIFRINVIGDIVFPLNVYLISSFNLLRKLYFFTVYKDFVYTAFKLGTVHSVWKRCYEFIKTLLIRKIIA